MTNRILTTHVGSLVRSPELVEFLLKQQNGDAYDQQAFEACLKRSVDEVVRQQVEHGIDIVSDGEFGKTISWSRYILDRINGFSERPAGSAASQRPTMGKDRSDFLEFYKEYESEKGVAGMGRQTVRHPTIWTITGPISYSGQAALQRDIDDIKSAASKAGATSAFLPVVAPASVVPDRRDEYYKTEEEALFAIADALNVEYKMITDQGLIVQIDDAHLCYMYDRMVPPGVLDDYRRWASMCIEATNHALRGIPEERSRYHLCWGSWNGPHTNDVPLKDIVDLVLKVRVGGYALEMANPRHEHEWRVWDNVKLPAGRKLIPGLVSHATNVVEHPELVAERIVRLAKLVGRENLIAGTDCGFAQGPFTRRVHPSIQWAKLDSLVAGARMASQQLWP